MRKVAFTPPEIAKRWGCKPGRVVTLIKSGRLAGFSLSPEDCKRKRWRVMLSEVERFERGEPAVTAAKPSRRKRRRNTEVFEFF